MHSIIRKTLTVLLILGLVLACLPAFETRAAATTGTFTAAAMNVDGLPQKIWGFSINADGPGAAGTKKISQKLAEFNWDIIGVSEDFNFDSELRSALESNYNFGTWRGKVSGLTNNTDGLNLIWKKSVSVSGEKWVHWQENYASGILGTDNGADTMIDKGYRFYQATVAEGVTIDVYILHMDAASDAEDIAAREAQLVQLRTAILESRNGNPILVMGDTNCRYTREHLESSFIDVINADDRFTIQDAWIEKCKNGVYPVYGSASLMVGDLGYVEGEIVDKMFYINNTESNVTLTLDSFRVETDFTDENGAPLADHFPVVGQFTYTVRQAHTHSYESVLTREPSCTETGLRTFTCSCGDSYTEPVAALTHSYTAAVTGATCISGGFTTYTCQRCGDQYVADPTDKLAHAYVTETQEATCTAPGKITYTCSACGDSYFEQTPMVPHAYEGKTTDPTCTEAGETVYTCLQCGDSYREILPALGHNYVDGFCQRCHAEEPAEPAEPTLGAAAEQLQPGMRYVITVRKGSVSYFLGHRGNTLTNGRVQADFGNALQDEMIWSVEAYGEGYSISTVVNGKTMYLGQSSFALLGFRTCLQEAPFEWQIVRSEQGFRIYFSNSYGSSYGLRYVNASYGWLASTASDVVTLYEVKD